MTATQDNPQVVPGAAIVLPLLDAENKLSDQLEFVQGLTEGTTVACHLDGPYPVAGLTAWKFTGSPDDLKIVVGRFYDVNFDDYPHLPKEVLMRDIENQKQELLRTISEQS